MSWNLKTVAEYCEHAQECRRLAQSIASAENKVTLLSMAETWENLAAEREKPHSQRGQHEELARNASRDLKFAILARCPNIRNAFASCSVQMRMF